jgi:hypothetical protein
LRYTNLGEVIDRLPSGSAPWNNERILAKELHPTRKRRQALPEIVTKSGGAELHNCVDIL